jgi:hypothetical protein
MTKMTTPTTTKPDKALEDILESGGIKVHPTLVQRKSFDVYMDGNGHFLCSCDGYRLQGDTLAELREKINDRLNRTRVRIALPITMLQEGVSIKHGTVTGMHMNGNFLVAWEDGSKGQIPSYTVGYSTLVYRRLNAEEVKTLLNIRKLQLSTAESMREFEADRRLSLQKAVEEETDRQREKLNAETSPKSE